METSRSMNIALANTRKYSKLAMAKNVANRQSYLVPVLLGDDGRFWVTATNPEAGMLITAGYEVAQ